MEETIDDILTELACKGWQESVRKIEKTLKDEEQETERLKNNINKGIEAINVYQDEKTLSVGYEDLKRIRGILQGNEFDLRMFEKHLQELKGVDKEWKK